MGKCIFLKKKEAQILTLLTQNRLLESLISLMEANQEAFEVYFLYHPDVMLTRSLR
jgi:hypothetical protein